MSEPLRMALNTTGDWTIVLADDDAGLAPIPADANLDASVWRGQDEAPLFAPAVSILDADAGAARVVIPPGQVANLVPGTYRLQVGVTYGGVRTLGYDGLLILTGAPGSGVPPRVFGTAADMYRYYGSVHFLQRLDHEQSGFQKARGAARSTIEYELLMNYRIRPGFVRRRGEIFDPICGFDRPDPTLLPPDREQLRAWLAGDQIVIDDELRKLAALLAVSIVFQRQETVGDASYPINAYQAEADRLKSEVDKALPDYRIRLATDPTRPDTTTIEITKGSTVVFLDPAA